MPAATCSCGRGYDIYEGGILGRVDDMKIIRGTNVYPRAVEAIVREYAAIDEFQDEEMKVVFVIEIVGADNIRMVEPGDGAGLTVEALQRGPPARSALQFNLN